MSFTESEIRRFWSKVTKTDTCWIWSGYTTFYGYGQFHYNGKRSQSAHRFSYILHKGEIAADKEIHHTCSNKTCVNLDHLEATSHQENIAAVEETVFSE